MRCSADLAGVVPHRRIAAVLRVAVPTAPGQVTSISIAYAPGFSQS